MTNLTLNVLPFRLAVCQIDVNDPIPEELFHLSFWSVTHTLEELSIILPEEAVQPGWKSEPGWRALQIPGPLEFSLFGVLAGISAPLAEARISIFALSTYNTDYILLKEVDLERAKTVLRQSGYVVVQGR
jgi:hypothetical protein